MKTISIATAMCFRLGSAGIVHAQGSENFPLAAVDALNSVFGKHAGFRASHAKGVCATGAFTATPEASSLSKAPLFSSSELKAEMRFSVGGGSPKVSDKAPAVRGLAVRFQVGYAAYDLLGISAPMFFAATPESLLSFLAARVPDPATSKPNPDKIKAHNERYPDGKLQPEYLQKTPPSASYATSRYFSNNAFKFTSADGSQVFGRYIIEPVAGVVGLTDEQRKSLPDEFLAAELSERVAKSPVAFDIHVQIAEAGDDVTNPTVVWPDSRKRVNVGRLKVTLVEAKQPGSCDSMMFNPTALPPGIEPSDDPILKMRAAAYAVSLGRRQAN